MTSILFNPTQVHKQEEIRKLETEFTDVNELKLNSRASSYNNHQCGGRLTAYNLRIATLVDLQRKKQAERNRLLLEQREHKRQNNELLRPERSLYEILTIKVQQAKKKLLEQSKERLQTIDYPATEVSPKRINTHYESL